MLSKSRFDFKIQYSESSKHLLIYGLSRLHSLDFYGAQNSFAIGTLLTSLKLKKILQVV